MVFINAARTVVLGSHFLWTKRCANLISICSVQSLNARHRVLYLYTRRVILFARARNVLKTLHGCQTERHCTRERVFFFNKKFLFLNVQASAQTIRFCLALSLNIFKSSTELYIYVYILTRVGYYTYKLHFIPIVHVTFSVSFYFISSTLLNIFRYFDKNITFIPYLTVYVNKFISPAYV